MVWVIGVDVGGTFTDFYALQSQTAEARLYKRPSTPHNPAEAILDGLAELCASAGIDGGDVDRVCHGTTVATNALIQSKGADVAVVTTKGFRDLLEIGRQTRPHMFSLQCDHPPPLVERSKRLEVAERISAGGRVVQPLELGSLARVIDELRQTGAQACAVCCLFSFLEPSHERAIAKRIRQELPHVFVSVSSDVQPEFREYERFSTTVLNAYLQPVLDHYLGTLEQRLGQRYPGKSLGIYQSIGGLMSASRARSYPVRTALSGPAAGVMGAICAAQSAQRQNVITLDMGGTSADVCLISDLKASINFERVVAGFPIRLPMIDIHTIGAGGGSIAWFERDGLLKVGPASAGAIPGPACYGLGGELPTVTDANCLLGRFPQAGLVGGRMPLEIAASRRAIAPVADQLKMSPEQAALGILGIVGANMMRAVRAITIEKGHDPADYALMAFGGAGPLHAVEVARGLNIGEVIIPAAPGILCAQGLIVSDLKESFVRSVAQRLARDMPDDLDRAVGQLHQDALAWAKGEGLATSDLTSELSIDVRYVGQNFELPVQVGSWRGGMRPVTPDFDTLRTMFFEAHAAHYGYHNPTAPIEIMNLRITALGRLSAVVPRPAAPDPGSTPKPIATQQVVLGEGGAIETPVYDRDDLSPGFTLMGPAIIQQFDATTVVHTGDKLAVDAARNILIEVAR